MQRALDNIKIGSTSITSTITATDNSGTTQSSQLLTTKTPSKAIEDKSGSISNYTIDNRTACDNTMDLTSDKSKQTVGRIRTNDCDEVRVMQKVLANEVRTYYFIIKYSIYVINNVLDFHLLNFWHFLFLIVLCLIHNSFNDIIYLSIDINFDFF